MGTLRQRLDRPRNPARWWQVAGALLVAAGVAWMFSGNALLPGFGAMAVGALLVVLAPTLGRWG